VGCSLFSSGWSECAGGKVKGKLPERSCWAGRFLPEERGVQRDRDCHIHNRVRFDTWADEKKNREDKDTCGNCVGGEREEKKGSAIGGGLFESAKEGFFLALKMSR